MPHRIEKGPAGLKSLQVLKIGETHVKIRKTNHVVKSIRSTLFLVFVCKHSLCVLYGLDIISLSILASSNYYKNFMDKVLLHEESRTGSLNQ